MTIKQNDALCLSSKLIEEARNIVGLRQLANENTAGTVAAALVSQEGSIFTGICIDTDCSLGFCAESAAIAEMLKAGQTRIKMIVAIYQDGTILPPCGRCRELMMQVADNNSETQVSLSEDTLVPLSVLLPTTVDVTTKENRI
jgi:cytidine deaminase